MPDPIVCPWASVVPIRIAIGISLSGGSSTIATSEPGGTTSTSRAPGQTSASVRTSQPSTSV
ncbi:MAG: hypothetical protein R2749_00115 [Acidimicrobiales bacterium]